MWIPLGATSPSALTKKITATTGTLTTLRGGKESRRVLKPMSNPSRNPPLASELVAGTHDHRGEAQRPWKNRGKAKTLLGNLGT